MPPESKNFLQPDGASSWARQSKRVLPHGSKKSLDPRAAPCRSVLHKSMIGDQGDHRSWQGTKRVPAWWSLSGTGIDPWRRWGKVCGSADPCCTWYLQLARACAQQHQRCCEVIAETLGTIAGLRQRVIQLLQPLACDITSYDFRFRLLDRTVVRTLEQPNRSPY